MENKQLNEQQLQALLRLKRFEQPPPGYFDDLLHAVHRRQREELLRRPAWRIFFDRIGGFFTSVRPDWAYLGSMAAVVMIGVGMIQIALPRYSPVKPVADAGQRSQTTEPITLAAQGPVLNLQGSPQFKILRTERNRPRETRDQPGNPIVPVRFIIDAQPASYEPSQIRF